MVGVAEGLEEVLAPRLGSLAPGSRGSQHQYHLLIRYLLRREPEFRDLDGVGVHLRCFCFIKRFEGIDSVRPTHASWLCFKMPSRVLSAHIHPTEHYTPQMGDWRWAWPRRVGRRRGGAGRVCARRRRPASAC